ncbi:unnamed protein product, partial [Ilex paraguariensis]
MNREKAVGDDGDVENRRSIGGVLMVGIMVGCGEGRDVRRLEEKRRRLLVVITDRK